MTCVNCGNPINEGETVCSQCNTPVSNENSIVTEIGVDTTNVELKDSSSVATKSKKKKFNKNLVIIIAAIAMFLIIIGFVLWNVLSGRIDHGKITVTGDLVDYGGYTFSFPDSYSHYQSNQYGLVISNNHIHYSIFIDYTNSWKKYKDFLETTFGEDAMNASYSKIVEREYYVFSNENEGQFTYHYFTTTKSGNVVAGFITLADYGEVATEDIVTLDNLIRTGVRVPSVSEVSKYDYGKSGMRVLEFNANFFDKGVNS